MCRVPDGRLVGQKVKLSPAQREWIEMIYGSPTRTFILSIPRKNAKTTTSAFLMLLHLCGPEAVPNGNAYSAAQSREQASILFSLAAKIVRMSPELSQYVAIKESAKTLICAELGTVYKALSAEASTAFGLSTSVVFHDELGQVRGPRSELYEALETASAAQANPLTIVISTQAPSPNDLLSLLISDAQTKSDPRIKCVVYQVPEDADVFDPDEIAKAQPNWHLMNQSEVLKMAADAKRMPSREASYRNYICNQQVEANNPFISKGIWILNSQDPDPAAFYENPVYVGLDLSAKTDLTAMVVAAFAGGKWHIRATFWTPEKGLADRARRDKSPYDVWVSQGHLRTLPGASLDYEMLAREIADALADMDVQAVAFDRWRFDILKKELDEIGADLPLIPFGQGFQSMSPALDTVESLLLNEQISHGGDLVLTMCMANTRVERDASGNRKLNKQKSTGRIDGAVALAMALGVAASTETQDNIDDFINSPIRL